MRIIYNVECPTSTKAAEALRNAGFLVKEKAVLHETQRFVFAMDPDPGDVAIFVPLGSVQWNKRHVMTTRRRVSDEHMPEWAKTFSQHIVLREHLNAQYAGSFAFAVVNAAKEIAVKIDEPLPRKMQITLNRMAEEANYAVIDARGKPKVRYVRLYSGY